MQIRWNPYKYRDVWEALENAEVYWGSFDDYFTTLVSFLENERNKYSQNVDNVISSGAEIDDSGQIPPEFEYAFNALASFPEFENIVFSSFFVTIYSYLESELTRHCRDLEKKNPEFPLFKNIQGKGIEKAMIYLIKIQRIKPSLNSSPIRNKIKNLGLLRNCITHNQGRLDEVFTENQREKLSKFIKTKESKVKLEDTKCILDREFCLDALETITKFLDLIADAEKPKTQQENTL